MRWKSPVHGDRRERKFFAWLPVSSREEPGSFRWLETVEVLEEYRSGISVQYWMVVRFLDRE